MNGPVTLPDLSSVPTEAALWPLLFGLGAYLVLTAQPFGRPKPDLAEMLRRLDVDERIRMDLDRRDRPPLFASRLLEALLRPMVDDIGRLFAAVLGPLGLVRTTDLERKLALARPGIGPVQFFGEKVASALIGFALFPLMNGLGANPFGTWPFGAWVVAAIAGFFFPEWLLERRLAERRVACAMELPTILDLLTIACSAGLSLEQALSLVAGQSRGIVARELQRVVREMALGQRSLAEALTDLGERNALPELAQVATQLRAAYVQGTPLVASLGVQAEALREQKRLRIVEQGGQATVTMVMPIVLFIVPVLFVVLLVPAAVALLHLGL